MQPGEMDALLQQAVRAIAESFEALTSPDTFDILCSFLKSVDAVPGILMNKLLDVIMSGFAAEVDVAAHDIDHEDQQTVRHIKYRWRFSKGTGRKGNAIEVASKNKAAEWSWNDQIVPILTLIAKVLKLKTSKIWTAKRPFLGRCLTAPAYHVTENEQYMKSEAIKLGVYKVICLANITAWTCRTDVDHANFAVLRTPLRECLNVLLKEFDHAQLGEEILREIAAKSFNAQNTKGPKTFLGSSRNSQSGLQVLFPTHVLILFDCLRGLTLHKLSDAHGDRRNHWLSHPRARLLEDLTSDAHQTQKQLNGLYDLLLERTLDLFSYVRSKVFPTLRPAHEIPQTASRHHAGAPAGRTISLIVKLMVMHPYGLMHGGLLGMEEWESVS
ncbi:non-SMC mitotic condensation complex subunit 1 [Lactifluus volemus]|nr:non-SMC mitotic condensation complex subunit 1 [Lactifluus volemus]